jgi:hypothetical protein
MHIEATSDEATLGRSVRKILDAIKDVRLAHPVAAAIKELPCQLDVGQIEDVVEAKGEMKNGVLKFTLGRPDVPVKCTRCSDLEIDATMGYNNGLRCKGRKSGRRYAATLRCLNSKSLPSSESSGPGE